MALFTSTNGYFEITDLSFSPNKVIAEAELGDRSGLEKTTYSITIKNVSGKKITGLSLYMTYGWINAQGEGSGSEICFLYGDLEYQEAITWNANTTKTFTGEWNIIYPEGSEPVFSAHALKPYYSTLLSRTELLRLTVNPNPEGYYDSFADISGENQKYLAVLDGFYSPSVVMFDADRVASDEDPNIATSAKLSLADGLSDDQKARMKWTVYCDGTSIPYDTGVTLDQLLTGITDSTTFITQQFDKDSNHDLVLTFGDEYELATSSTVTIPRGFANMHLSGKSTGGVCFGGFCKSTENNPMFECYYPAYFYGGIEGIKSVQCGRTESITVSKTKYSDVAVTFSTPFTEAPTVMLTIETSSVAYAMGSFLPTLLPGSITTDGFTMRLFNNTGSNRTFYVNWLAYGQM
jgi:hypothetical protein